MSAFYVQFVILGIFLITILWGMTVLVRLIIKTVKKSQVEIPRERSPIFLNKKFVLYILTIITFFAPLLLVSRVEGFGAFGVIANIPLFWLLAFVFLIFALKA